ncbi:MAG: hypothetical protein ACYT04_39750, partial [Nostoc sp.]
EAVALGTAAAISLADGIIGGLVGHSITDDIYIGDLQNQLNKLKNELDKDKPVKTSSITVQIFDHCDQDKNPVYTTQSINVVEGTEDAERLKFNQISLADGATCKIGYGNGFANLLNEMREIGALLLNGSEQTINTVATAFNALQDDGILSESNWKYYPDDVSLKAGALIITTDALTVINNETPKTSATLADQIKTEITNLDTTIQTKITEATTTRNQELNS